MEQQEQADVLKVRSGILTREILEDARKKAARIIQKAEKDAASLVKETSRQCDAIRSELGSAADKKALLEANKITAGAGLECKRLRLARVNVFLEELAEEGLTRLEAMTGAAALEVILRFLGGILPKVAAGEITLILSPDTGEAEPLAMIKKHRPDLAVSVQRDAGLFQGEFILEEEGGRLRYVVVFRDIYKLKRDGCLRAMYQVVLGGTS